MQFKITLQSNNGWDGRVVVNAMMHLEVEHKIHNVHNQCRILIQAMYVHDTRIDLDLESPDVKSYGCM